MNNKEHLEFAAICLIKEGMHVTAKALLKISKNMDLNRNSPLYPVYRDADTDYKGLTKVEYAAISIRGENHNIDADEAVKQAHEAFDALENFKGES